MSNPKAPSKRQITEAQLRANRENAKKSTGPITAQGKMTSARNSMKFGMTTTVAVLPNEDRVEYLNFSVGMFYTLFPVCTEEESLTLELTNQTWRLRRCADMEVDIHEKSRSLDETLNRLNKLSLHEARLTRNRERTRVMLMAAQKQRMKDQVSDEANQVLDGTDYRLGNQLRMMGFKADESALLQSIYQQIGVECQLRDQKLAATRSVDQELKDRLAANQAARAAAPTAAEEPAPSAADADAEAKAQAKAQMQHYKQQAEALALKLGFVLTPIDQAVPRPAGGTEKPPR